MAKKPYWWPLRHCFHPNTTIVCGRRGRGRSRSKSQIIAKQPAEEPQPAKLPQPETPTVFIRKEFPETWFWNSWGDLGWVGYTNISFYELLESILRNVQSTIYLQPFLVNDRPRPAYSGDILIPELIIRSYFPDTWLFTSFDLEGYPTIFYFEF